VISHKSVELILETAKIEEVVGDFVNLKRRGSNLIGLCPFHQEKTPSFSVSPSKNIFKCFGCGRGGGVAQFLMEHEHMSFPEALRYLARKYNIDIEESVDSDEAREERQRAESLYLVNDFARQFFERQLFNSDRGRSVGLGYFRQRGYEEETIREFGLGFAPNERDAFAAEALRAGYDARTLNDLGLLKEGRDFFRDRVMFSIHNLSGKVVGFAGRILRADAKAPKYINTPETEIYHKSRVLYGAFFAKRAIRQLDECILVEGYTDVLSLHQAGIENVVATSGTSLTLEQIGMIKRLTANVTFLFDGDQAGVKAALRGMDMVLEQDLNVKIVLLPPGEDPDSYLRTAGVAQFKDYLLAEAKDFLLFKAGLLLEEAGDDPVKKTAVIKDIVESIARIPDPLKRSLFVKECAKLVAVEEQLLINETNKIVGHRLRALRQKAEAQLPAPEGELSEAAPALYSSETRPPNDAFQEKDLARVLICYGDRLFDEEEKLTVAEYILANIEDVLDYLDQEIYGKVILECHRCSLEGLTIQPARFIGHPDKDISRLAADLLSTPYHYSDNWERRWDISLQTQRAPDENFKRDATSSLKHFKLRKIRKFLAQTSEKIKALNHRPDDPELITQTKVHLHLKQMERELAKDLGMVVLR
jgi:DNA primase